MDCCNKPLYPSNNFFHIFRKKYFTNSKSSAIISRVEQAALQNVASWCSRLARQPVTLEVDGSSPFEVAKNKSHPIGWLLFFVTSIRTRTIQCNTPVECCPMGRAPSAPYNLPTANWQRVRSRSSPIFCTFPLLSGNCHVDSLLTITSNIIKEHHFSEWCSCFSQNRTNLLTTFLITLYAGVSITF